ncbi:hypothetical protein C7974DRAFT_451893 [Boeremia exigua]|uniref:uncharacterized protein n=1 Tax=Boeremia exigua TaxID=749465 RepID=UPI001E8DF35D|nr:uncharacterized protein C7974DRAFT_451893 [Boeremia exigua]KAH6638498.1 hypothetical protein C7974DRAFT_451893 [Boeremia exigua]
MASTLDVLHPKKLDQTMLRMYIRQLLVFPFPDVSVDRKEEALAGLALGLLVTLKQFPFLAGTIEQTSPSTGAMTVRYPSSISLEDVSRILKVTNPGIDELSYDTLCEAGIPPSRLHSEDLCPVYLRSHAGLDDQFAGGLTTFAMGVPIPVFAAQINFISNGLILSACTHHSVVDGTGIARVYQQWSKHTHIYSNGMGIPEQIKTSSLNGAWHAFDSPILDKPRLDPPEFRYPGDLACNPPLRDAPYELRAKVIVFSVATVFQLADRLSVFSKKHISTFAALTALLWCQITNVRRDAMTTKGIKETKVGVAIDHCKRIGSLLLSDYVGNCANGMTVSLPLSTISSGEALNGRQFAHIAVAISNGQGDIDIDWFRNRLSAMSKQDNSSRLLLNVDTRNGPDVIISSWMHIGADDVWAIPGTTSAEEEHKNVRRWRCKPTAIRKPRCANEGSILILPAGNQWRLRLESRSV